MERVFWVRCPGCNGRFYCNYQQLRFAGIKLECPFCQQTFLPDQSPELDDRAEG
jgi:predicted Zn finger-like uncharacterized protein